MKNLNSLVTKEQISDVAQNCVKVALKKWASNFQIKYSKKSNLQSKNHLDILFPKERRIHSVIQSALTSFGRVGWEPLANDLASLGGYEVFSADKFNKHAPKIPKLLRDFKQKIRAKIQSKDIKIQSGLNEIKSFIKEKNLVPEEINKIESGQGIDFWFRKDNYELIGDIKSPQDNIGNGLKLIDHALIWGTCRLLEDPEIQIEAVIAFPYNPYEDLDVYMKEQGQKFYLHNYGQDILIADSFWDKLTGYSGTTRVIFDSIKSLSNSDEIREIRKLFDIK